MLCFLHSIKTSGYRLRMKFDKDPLEEQNKFPTNIVNVCIVYDLDACTKTLFNKSLAYPSNFCNVYARNVVISGADNSSSSHADNRKNNFLVLVERPAYGINGSFNAPEKGFSFNFSKAITTFCLNFHCNRDNSYLFVSAKKVFKFKADNNNVNFLTQFCLGSISNGVGAGESREV